jgi:flagellar protein FlaG
MAMTNDIGVYSLIPAAPVSRKEQSDPIKASGSVNLEQDSSSDEGLVSVLTPEKQPERGELEQTVDDLNGLVQDLQRQVRFSLDDDSGEMVVKVVDRETDDVIRQIPSEEVLQLRDRLEQATGAIFKDRA